MKIYFIRNDAENKFPIYAIELETDGSQTIPGSLREVKTGTFDNKEVYSSPDKRFPALVIVANQGPGDKEATGYRRLWLSKLRD